MYLWKLPGIVSYTSKTMYLARQTAADNANHYIHHPAWTQHVHVIRKWVSLSLSLSPQQAYHILYDIM